MVNTKKREMNHFPLSSSTKSSPRMWGPQPSLGNFLHDLWANQKAIVFASSPTMLFPSYFFGSTCFSQLYLQTLVTTVLYSVTATQSLSRDLNTVRTCVFLLQVQGRDGAQGYGQVAGRPQLKSGPRHKQRRQLPRVLPWQD